MPRLSRFVLIAGLIAAPAVATTPSGATSATPTFRTVVLAGSTGQSEPRVTVRPDDGRMFLDTNATTNNEVIYASSDGLHWALTGGQPEQTQATTDVDIVSMHTGRVLATELDDAGINFRTDYTDDNGATWHTSLGNTFADTDRPWYAVGPDDPTSHLPRVYLLFHNLLSGALQHNMFVATSTDGGATFGPPIPVATPGQQDYADLQCADSGGPSNIFTDARNGQVYVVFGTRSSSSPLSGCTAQPPEINVVAANRVWVVTAPAAQTTTPGAWTPHLAVNDTGPPAHIVGMQLAPGAVDTAGNVYVAYPESINDYPDYDGGAIKVVHASASDLDHWSAPAVVAPSGGPGNVLPHIVAGRPGQVDVAWYHGVSVAGHKPDWYSYAAQSLDALGTTPHWTSVRLSSVLAEHDQTASELMGACIQGSGATLNGFACGRSTDVNGIALDRCGALVVTWPAQAGLKTDATYVSRQTGGPDVLSCPKTATKTTSHSGGSGGTSRGSGLATTGAPATLGVMALALIVAGLLTRRLSRRRRS